jgi:hypothetical protein
MKVSQRDFPIKEAYKFAAANGLGAQAETIRKNPFRFDRRGLRDRSSSIRSGYMIVLFQSKGLFEKFQKEHWPYYETEHGKAEFRAYHKLVLLTSVLESYE